MPVRELLARVDSRELAEWMAYEQVTGPLGPERADIHAGIIAAAIHNANTGKRGRKAKPRDFIPRWDRAAQTWEEQLAVIRRVNSALGGREVRRG